MRKLLCLLSLLPVFAGLSATSGFAASASHASLVMAGTGPPIEHLWFSPRIKVSRSEAHLHGTLAEKNSTLAINFERVKCDEKGRFAVNIPLERGQTELTIQLVDPLGELTEEHALLTTGEQAPRVLASATPPDADAVSTLNAPEGDRQWLYVPPPKLSVQLTDLSYQQPDLSVSEMAVTVKGAWNRVISPRKWDLGLSAFFTALPLSTSGAQDSIRFFGLNANLGYEFPTTGKGWSFGLRGGIYYVTSSASQGDYGFANMYGPEIYPTLAKTFAHGGKLSGYLKFAPVSNSLQLSFSSYEFAGGMSFQPTPSRDLFYSLDIARLNLQISGVSAQATSVSLGVGIGL